MMAFQTQTKSPAMKKSRNKSNVNTDLSSRTGGTASKVKLTLSNKKKNLPDYLLYGIGRSPERKPKTKEKVGALPVSKKRNSISLYSGKMSKSVYQFTPTLRSRAGNISPVKNSFKKRNDSYFGFNTKSSFGGKSMLGATGQFASASKLTH